MKKNIQIKISASFGQFLISSWVEKGHKPSRAENLSARLWLIASSSSICSSISLFKIILQELKLTILYTRDHVNSSEFRLHSMFYTHTFSIYCALFCLVLFYQKVCVCSFVSLLFWIDQLKNKFYNNQFLKYTRSFSQNKCLGIW